MKFTVEKGERYVVIEPLVDKLDGAVAAKLKAEFMLRHTGGQRNIVLDLNQVKETDEAGIRMGLLARRLCKATGGLFVLIGLRPNIIDFMKTVRLDSYFITADNLEAAKDLIFGNEIRLDLKGEK